jgi:hypothetical protein
MRLVELLPQFRNFDDVGLGKKNSKQHASPASPSCSQSSHHDEPVQLQAHELAKGPAR